MKIIRRPTVYLVGRQVLDRGEITRFLSDHGIEQWRLDKGWIARKSFIVDRLFSTMLTKLLAVSHGIEKTRKRMSALLTVPPFRCADECGKMQPSLT